MGCSPHRACLDPGTFHGIDYPSDNAELTCRVRDGFVGRTTFCLPTTSLNYWGDTHADIPRTARPVL
jgi:hypothetical protein